MQVDNDELRRLFDTFYVPNGVNNNPVRIGVFVILGNLSVKSNPVRLYNKFGRGLKISQVFIAVNTAPTGAAVIADVNKNGVTIFTNPANRPQIAAAANTGNTTTIDVPSLADGDYLTVDIDQIGSVVAGADLTVEVIGM